jgi:hypothetical protein
VSGREVHGAVLEVRANKVRVLTCLPELHHEIVTAGRDRREKGRVVSEEHSIVARIHNAQVALLDPRHLEGLIFVSAGKAETLEHAVDEAEKKVRQPDRSKRDRAA